MAVLVASESETLNRKQRQLERLRREAAKRGYIGKAAGEKKVDKKQVEKLLVKPVAVADEQANSERVPPIREVIAKEEDLLVKQTSNTAEGNKNLKKDEFHARISERFAAFEVRKQRMRQLRSRLNQFEEQKMEDTYGQAIDRLQNLTSMRKQLESMQIAENSSCSEGMKGVVDEVEAEVSSSSSQEKSKLIELHSKLSSQELDSVDGSVTTDEVDNSTTPNEQSFESIGKQKTAALRLDTEGAELEKRRTLENVRLYANTTNPMENSQKVENSIVYRNVDAETEETLSYSTNGIEKEIFIMVEFIVPWIDKRRHELVRQDALDGFRDAILLKTKEIFSANEHIHSSNFEKQLGAIIDDCLAKYKK